MHPSFASQYALHSPFRYAALFRQPLDAAVLIEERTGSHGFVVNLALSGALMRPLGTVGLAIAGNVADDKLADPVMMQERFKADLEEQLKTTK